MMHEPFQPANQLVRAILDRLLTANFPGVELLRLQVPSLKVRQIDDDGSLELKVEHEIPANVTTRVPVEASYSDTGDVDPFAPRVHILLHVIGGLMKELEFYKSDGTEIRRPPEPEELVIETNEAWESGRGLAQP
jgi:hypothetical protein